MSESGFTLIEVLAALLVFSIAIIGLSHSGSESVRAVSVLEHKSYAGIVADNQLIRARLRPLQRGVETGESQMAGRDYDWRVETVETDSAGFFRMTVSVSQKDSEQTIMTRIAYRSPS